LVQESKIRSYHINTQHMASTQPLKSRNDLTRHQGENLVVYREEQHPGYEHTGGQLKGEHAGVLHFVHGWIQQGQKDKVNLLLFISSSPFIYDNLYRDFTSQRV